MALPARPVTRQDVASCVRATLDDVQAGGESRDAAVSMAFRHCQLPGVEAMQARTFTGVVNRPGIEYPSLPGVNHAVPVDITPDFLRLVQAASPPEVVANLLHEGRTEKLVVGMARHRMDGDQLVADFDIDVNSAQGAVVEAIIEAGIADGVPVQVSFEIDDLRFADDAATMAAVERGELITPIGGVLGAISILPGVPGACGDDCAITSLAACSQGGTCADDCCPAPTFTVRGTLRDASTQGEALKNNSTPSQTRRTMTSQPEVVALQAAHDTLAAEVATERQARMTAEAEVKALRESMDDAAMPADVMDRIANLEKENAHLVSVNQAREEEAREALVMEVKESAPADFEVDADATTEVLLATLRAFRASAPKVAAPAKGMRLHASKADGKEIGGDDRLTLNRLLAKHIKGNALPHTFQKNGAPFSKED